MFSEQSHNRTIFSKVVDLFSKSGTSLGGKRFHKIICMMFLLIKLLKPEFRI